MQGLVIDEVDRVDRFILVGSCVGSSVMEGGKKEVNKKYRINSLVSKKHLMYY